MTECKECSESMDPRQHNRGHWHCTYCWAIVDAPQEKPVQVVTTKATRKPKRKAVKK